MSVPDWIATIGVSLLLLAYVLDVTDTLADDSPWFFALNAIGAAMACYAALLIRFWPFVVLEGIWAAVSVVALLRRWLRASELTPEEASAQLQQVYSAEDLIQAQMLVDTLASEGIEAHVLGQYLSGGAGELPMTSLLRVVCPARDWARARAIVESFEAERARTAVQDERSVDAGMH
jgi:hypothetical protein